MSNGVWLKNGSSWLRYESDDRLRVWVLWLLAEKRNLGSMGSYEPMRVRDGKKRKLSVATEWREDGTLLMLLAMTNASYKAPPGC